MLLHNNPENEKQMEILAMDDIMDDSSDDDYNDYNKNDKMIIINDKEMKNTMNTKGISTPSTCTGMSSSTQQSSGARSEIIVIDSDSD